MVVDSTPPAFTAPPNLSLDCSSSTAPSNTGWPSVGNDTCSGTTTNFIDAFVASCGTAGTLTRTWLVSDACGNTTPQVQIITITDTTPPSFTPPADLTIDCTDPRGPATTGMPSVSADDCSGTTTNFIDTFTAGCGTAGTIARTWQVADACGNPNTHVQMITIVDTSAPTFIVPPDLTLSVGDPTTPATTGTASGHIDDCGSITTNFTDQFATTNSFTGVLRREWTAWDACGNTNLQIQTITILDNAGPVFTPPANHTINAGAPSQPPATGVPSGANDPCGIGGTSHSDLWSPTVNSAGTITRTWFVWDNCGNTNTATQIITVLPNSPDLSVTAVSSPSVLSSSNVTITVTVENLGPGTAFNVALTNQLPMGLASATTANPNCSIIGGTLLCNWGMLAASANQTVSIQLVSDGLSAAPLTNRAVVASDAADLNPADNQTLLVIGQLDNDGDGIPDWSDPDDDNDGIPDWWELQHNLDPNDPADAAPDADSDGMSNLEEWICDTDPNDITEYLRLTDDTELINGHKVYFPAKATRLYTVQSTTELLNIPWTDVPGLIDLPGINGVQEAIDSRPGLPLRFYRVRARVP